MSPTVSALLGSILTAFAIFAGGLAVEAYKSRRDRQGMALALAGAIDAMLRLVAVRDVGGKLSRAVPELEAGRPAAIGGLGGLVEPNGPFKAITLTYAGQLGHLGGDLPFRVARFLTHIEGLQHDLDRISGKETEPELKALLIRQIFPLWREAELLGTVLVQDLRLAAGYSPRRPESRPDQGGTAATPPAPA